jgi:hypothetical protein
MAKTTLRILNPTDELHPESEMARRSRASRRRAALKGLRRRRSSTGTRKGARRKTARRAFEGLKRRRRRNPTHSTKKGMVRRTARRAYAPVRRRRRNPSSGRKFTFNRFFKRTGELLGVALPVLWIDNFIANFPTRKEGEIVQQTVSQMVGPAYPLIIHTAMLAFIPNLLMRKGALAPFRGRFNDILGVLVAFDVLQLAAFAARRQWSLDEAKAISPLAENYPAWTDYLTPVQPEPMVKLAGAYQHAQLQGALHGAQFVNPAELQIGSR